MSDWKNAIILANYLRRAESYRMYDYQTESILCNNPRKVHQDGRDVGKTTEIEITHIYQALSQPQTESLIATQWEHNLNPTSERLIAAATRHPEIARHVTRIVRSPYLRIEFDNGSLLMGKIAGTGGVNFQNTHVHLISVDEAQNLFESSWQQLFPSLLTGGRLHIYGVPNGLRNRYYHLTRNEGFQLFHWPARLNPAYTPEKDEEMASLYGGRDTPGYVHNILGEHGSPEESVFGLDLVERCLKGPPEIHLVIQSGEVSDSLDALCQAFVASHNKTGSIFLGVDVGYAQDPTIVSVWREEDRELFAAGIVEMRNTRYMRQAEIIANLFDSTGAAWVGIDRGGGGESVIENLAAIRPDLAGRVLRGMDDRYGFLFHESVEYEVPGGIVKRRMKVAATEQYRSMMEAGRVHFSSPARAQELVSHTYSLNARGEVVYNKGDDHIIDADRCVMYGLLLQQIHRSTRPPDLVAFKWI